MRKVIMILVFALIFMANIAVGDEFPASKYFPRIKTQEYSYMFWQEGKSERERLEYTRLKYIGEGLITIDNKVMRSLLHGYEDKIVPYIELEETKTVLYEQDHYKRNIIGEQLESGKWNKEGKILCGKNVNECKKYYYNKKQYIETIEVVQKYKVIEIDGELAMYDNRGGIDYLRRFWGVVFVPIKYRSCKTDNVINIISHENKYDNCSIKRCDGIMSVKEEIICNGIGVVQSRSENDTESESIYLMGTKDY